MMSVPVLLGVLVRSFFVSKVDTRSYMLVVPYVSHLSVHWFYVVNLCPIVVFGFESMLHVMDLRMHW